jgi:DNA-binding response OmpR family regulator
MKNRFLKGLKVLLVEDEEKLALFLKNAIGDSFYRFYVANNGKDGLEQFLALKPDVVITDITMPELSGLAMAKEIRKTNPKIPIIILSAYGETDKFLDAIDVGVSKYFIKPYDPDELLEYINTIGNKLEEKIVDLDNNFSFNKSSNALYKNAKYVALTKKELEFIHLLLKESQNAGFGASDGVIKEKLWTQEVSQERLRAFISRLRAKTSKELIVNVKGYGYRLPIA